MADIQIKDLVGPDEIQNLKNLDETISKLKETFVGAATELAKGINIDVSNKADLDKLYAVVATQSKTANEATEKLNAAMREQSELAERVAKSLNEQAKSGNLSAKETKALADAGKKNAEQLEKMAKGEAALEKARRTGTKATKDSTLSEAERKKIIAEAITLSGKEVHSIQEANEANKKLRQAVKLVRDTDEDYRQTLGKLNSTIGVNTDYVRRNTDRYTRQKMTIGDYKEQIKLAWMEINRGNDSMRNMGVIASNLGGIVRSKLSTSFSEVKVSVGTMIKGFVGAQAVMSGIQALIGAVKSGIQASLQFETSNSKLAAILGTTAQKTKDLQYSARELGATTRYTAAEATDLQIELAKLGFTAAEIKDSTKYILRFAQATGAELPDAAALSGAALRMFNASTAETERYVSAMAVATSRSALSFSYLATAMPIVGPVAKAFNFSIEDTLALLGKLADSGFDASMAATATRNIFLNLADSSGKLAKALGKPVTSLPELVDGLQKLKEKGVDLNTTLELTDKRSVAAFNAFLTAADKILPLREQITGVEKELKGMADEMDNNVEGSLKALQSAWEEFMITITRSKGAIKSFIDACADGIRWLTDLLSSNDEKSDKRKFKAIEEGAAAAAEVMKGEKKIIEDLTSAYEKSGLDREKALEKAKAKRIAMVRSEYEEQHKLMEKYKRENIKLNEDKKNASLFKQGLGLEMSNSQYNKEINRTFNQYLSALRNVSLLEEQMKRIGEIGGGSSGGGGGHFTTDKELEKQLKAQQAFEDSKIELMEDGLNKELAKISQSYAKKMAAVKGNSEAEVETRKNLSEKMEKELAEYRQSYMIKYEQDRLKIRMDFVKKDTKEYLDLQLRENELACEAELRQADKTGQSKADIESKYFSKRMALLESFASTQVQKISEDSASEQAVRNAQLTQELTDLKKSYLARRITREQYEQQELAIAEKFAKESAEATIASLEKQLGVENLSAKDRKRIYEQLQKAKSDMASSEADAEIKLQDKIAKADKKSHDDRVKNVRKWLQVASQAIGNVGELFQALYDGQIKGIERQQEANNDAYDKDVERTELLVEKGAISEEEGEARKRAAKAKTEKKNEELEKKKLELEYKKAMWQKATSIAQAGIATALAITEALPNVVLAAIVGAMGAVQIATIAATPIQAYAKGTGKEGHKGGPALVGDGGKHEVVTYDGKAWITPDTPVLLDLPKGAQVFPDAATFKWDDFKGNIVNRLVSDKPKVIVNNNYKSLESKMSQNNDLLRRSIIEQRRIASMNNYNIYKMSL